MKIKRAAISEVLLFQEGPGVRNNQYTTEGVKLLNVANLVDGKIDLSTSNRYISEEEAYGKYSHFLCEEGDLIVASSGIKVDYIDKKMGFIEKSMLPLCMNTSTIRFKVIDENVLRIRYFMYYLKSNNFKSQLYRHITGSAQLNYGPSHLKKMDLPIVDIFYQDKIINKLDSIQSLIELKYKQLHLLDELVKSQFIELFEEKGYNEVPINSILETSFWLMPATPKYLIDGEIPYITSKNIKNRKINFDDVKLISKKDYYRISYNRPIMKGDILISMIGTLGQIAIVGDNRKFYGQNIYLLRLNKKIIDETYFCEFFDSDKIQHKLQEKSHKSTQAYLKANHVEDLTIILPPISNQKSFKKFVQKVDKSKFTRQKF